MTDADLTLLSDALGIPAERVEAVVSLLRTVVGGHPDETFYTVDDVLARVPWSRTTVDKMVKRRQIPMLYIEGRWVITAASFRTAAAKGFPLPAGRVATREQGRKRRAPDRKTADAGVAERDASERETP